MYMYIAVKVCKHEFVYGRKRMYAWIRHIWFMNGIFIRHILDVYWIINDNNYIIYTVYASKSDTRRMLMCNYAKRRKVCHERERGSKIKVGRASHIKAIEYLIRAQKTAISKLWFSDFSWRDLAASLYSKLIPNLILNINIHFCFTLILIYILLRDSHISRR